MKIISYRSVRYARRDVDTDFLAALASRNACLVLSSFALAWDMMTARCRAGNANPVQRSIWARRSATSASTSKLSNHGAVPDLAATRLPSILR